MNPLAWIALSLTLPTPVLLGQHAVGPYLVHSIPAGPSLSKDLPPEFPPDTKTWSEYAFVNADTEGQNTVLAGWGDPATEGLRTLQLVGGVPVAALGKTALTAAKPLGLGWHLLAETYDGTTLRLFVDGVQSDSTPFESKPVAPRIAFSPDSTANPNSSFSGRIAFYVATRALSATELARIAANRPNFEVALFEENSKPWSLQISQREGYIAPQPPDEMPHGAPPQAPVAKPLPPAGPTLQPAQDGSWEIAANWRMMTEAPGQSSDGRLLSSATLDDTAWYRATVPGTVLTTLIDRGVYPDPDYGLNNLAIPESLNKQGAWFRVSFPVPPHTAGERVHLCFGGVSYAAEFFLNGQKLGQVTGAFERATFDVTALTHTTNTLAVHILPPPHPGIPQEQSLKGGPGLNGGSLVIDGPNFMATEGWDWMPAMRDRDMGIWQPVTLAVTGSVTLGDPQVITHLPLPDTSRADLEIHLPVHNASDHALHVRAKFSFEGGEASVSKLLPPGDSILDLPSTTMLKPRLWWPNGYGDPNLYHATIELFDDESHEPTDRRSMTFGVRQVSVELSLIDHAGMLRRVEVDPTEARAQGITAVDVRHEAMRSLKSLWAASLTPEGERSSAVKPVDNEPGMTDLVIKVNGVRIAARGGNWGMDDTRKRVSREKMEPYFRLHREANLNIIRNWQGQNTEEIFYQLADEYGLMVWNDFWMATENSNPPPADPQLMMENVRDTVRRYRNHPSIILWCGRNEGVPPPVINERLIALLREEDGTRYYSPSSNRINLRPSGPYQWEPPGDYYSRIDRGFSVELGTSSFPTLEAFDAMMPPADRWPMSDTWAYHDWHQGRGGDTHILMAKMNQQLGPAGSIEEFERQAQMFNFVDHQAIFEGLYQHLWAPNSGRMLWMTHSAWPSMMWQIYSADYDTQASYFAVKRANSPLHPQMDMSNGTLAVVNTTLTARPGLRLRVRVVDPSNQQLELETIAVDAAANATQLLKQLPLSELFAQHALILVRLDLLDAADQEISDNFYWMAKDDKSYRGLRDIAPAKIAIVPTVVKGGLALRVTNSGTVPAIEIKLGLFHPNGSRVLPAYWDDNYVSLLPGESRLINVSFSGESSPRLSVRGWNIPVAQVHF